VSVDGPDGWGAPLHARVLDLAGVGAGTTLLDLGCGPGVFARAAVERGALVTGVDADPTVVAAAERAVPGARFRVGDAEQPPPGPFDVVAAVQVLQHVSSPLAVLRGACAVGGTVVVTVWGREEECGVGLFGEVLGRWLPPRPVRPGPPPVTDPARLAALAESAGLEIVRVEEVTCPFTYRDADELVGPLFDTGMGRAAVNRAGPDAVREAVLERLADRRRPDGGYVLQNLFRVLLARPTSGPSVA
jgi:SAM-dependent methyltransferase